MKQSTESLIEHKRKVAYKIASVLDNEILTNNGDKIEILCHVLASYHMEFLECSSFPPKEAAEVVANSIKNHLLDIMLRNIEFMNKNNTDETIN